MTKDHKQLNVIIPLRSKSKGIKNKNLLKVGKYPLAVKCINTILKSGLGKKIIIATDSKDYIKKIKKFFKNEKKLIYFIRSKKSALPNSKTEVVINEIIERINFQDEKNILLVQATSPALNYKDLIYGYKKFIKNNFDSLFSCYKSKKFIWVEKNKKLISVNYDYKNRPMRQSFTQNLVENGAFYFFKKKGFKKYKNRLFKKIGYHVMPENRSFELDEPNDIKNIKNL